MLNEWGAFHDDVITWKHFPRYWLLCAGNSPITDEFPSQRPVTQSFDVFFDQHLNKRLSKQWWGWWFETPLHPSWRHCNVVSSFINICCGHDVHILTAVSLIGDMLGDLGPFLTTKADLSAPKSKYIRKLSVMWNLSIDTCRYDRLCTISIKCCPSYYIIRETPDFYFISHLM